MKRKLTLLLLIFIVVFSTSSVYAQNGYLLLKTKSYKKYKLFNKTFSGGSTSSSILLKPNFPYIGCTFKCNKKGEWASSSTASSFFNRELFHNYYNDVNPQQYLKDLLKSKPYDKILKLRIKPVLDINNDLEGAQYSLIKYKRLSKLGESVYDIENKFFTDKNISKSEILSFVDNNKQFVDRKLKVVLNKKLFSEEYEILEFEYHLNHPPPLTEEKTIEQILPKGTNLIEAPFNYDLLYSNSIEQNIKNENIKQNTSNKIEIKTIKSTDKFTKVVEYKRYSLESKLFPIKLKNNKLKIYGFFNLSGTSLDKDYIEGGTAIRSFSKIFTINTSDIIEIKLPDQWTEKEFQFSNEDKRVEHFITITPVKTISNEYLLDKDYFKPSKTISVSENDKIK